MDEKPYNIKRRCYQFSKKIVQFVSNTKFERIHFSIFDQLIRSGTSIGANIIEAKSGSSTKDFKNFYTISLKSANETKYWLCLTRDIILSEEKDYINKLISEADDCQRSSLQLLLTFKSSFDF